MLSLPLERQIYFFISALQLFVFIYFEQTKKVDRKKDSLFKLTKYMLAVKLKNSNASQLTA